MKLNYLAIDTAIEPLPLIVKPENYVADIIRMLSDKNCKIINNEYLTHNHQISCVLVQEFSQTIGIITEQDLVELIANDINLEKLKAINVMTHPLIIRKKTELPDIFSVINLFFQFNINHLPIIDEDESLLGIINSRSINNFIQNSDLFKWRCVKDIMKKSVIFVQEKEYILSIAQKMSEKKVSFVIVTEENHSFKPIGILTKRDIIELQALKLDLKTISAQTVMSRSLFTVNHDDSLWMAYQEMQKQQIHHLVVTGDRGEMLGLISDKELLSTLKASNMYNYMIKLQQEISHLRTEKPYKIEDEPLTEYQNSNQELIESLKQHWQRECLLGKISSHIRQSLNLEEVLETTVMEVREFLNVERVIVYQFNSDWSGIVVAESVTPPWKSISGQVIHDYCFAKDWVEPYKNGRIQASSDIYQENLSPCHIKLLEKIQVRANLVVPILQGKNLWGLLAAQNCSQPRIWRQRELELLIKLATQVAIAIQQSTLFEEVQLQLQQRKQAEKQLQIQAQQQAALAALGNTALAETNLDKLMNEAVALVSRTLKVQYCKILELLPNEAAFILRAGVGWPKNWIKQAKVSTDLRSQAGYTLLEKKPVIVEDLPVERRFGGSPLLHNQNVISGCTVIIKGKERPFGVLGVHSIRHRIFTHDDVHFLEAIANIIATAVERSSAEAQLDRFFNLSLDLFCIAGPDGFFKLVNPSFESILGFSKEELLVTPFINFVHPEDIEVTLAEFHRLQTGIPAINFENRYRCKNGSYRWLSWNAQPFEEGTVYAVARDITESKEAQQKLFELNEQLETRVAQRTAELEYTTQRLIALMENLQGGVLLKDENNQVILSNQVFWDLFEIPEANSDSIPDDVDSFALKYQHLFAQPETWSTRQKEIIHGREIVTDEEFTLANHKIIQQDYVPIYVGDNYAGYLWLYRDITQRKSTEAALRESENLLRIFIQTAGTILIVLAPNGKIKEWNEEAEKLYGYRRESILEENYFDRFVPSGEKNRVRADINKVLAGIPTRNFETFVLTSDGTQKCILWNVNRLVNTQGIVIGVIACGQDMAERKKAEAALLLSEKRFRSIFDGAAVGIVQFAISGEILLVNDRFIELLHYSRSELKAQKLPEIIDKNDINQTSLALNKLLSGEISTFSIEIRLICQNSSLLWVNLTLSLVSGSNIESRYFIGVINDISDRKKAEEALQQSQEFLRHVIDTNPNLIFVQDCEGRFTLANVATADLFGTDVENLIGKTDADFDFNLGIANQSCSLLTNSKTSKVSQNETPNCKENGDCNNLQTQFIPEKNITMSNGENRCFQIIKKPLSFVNSNTFYFLGVATDITESKQAKNQLLDSLREKEVLLKEIHHRVKNNLYVISSLLNLQSNYIEDEAAISLFQDSQNRIQTMAMIHEQLYQSNDLAQIDFTEYIKKLINNLFLSYNNSTKNIKSTIKVASIKLNLETAIPCGLLINELITNCFKHAFPDRDYGEIKIQLEVSNHSKMYLTVADNGIGLPPNLNWEESPSLGLRLVRILTQQLDGNLQLTTSSSGTSFCLIFSELKYKDRI